MENKRKLRSSTIYITILASIDDMSSLTSSHSHIQKGGDLDVDLRQVQYLIQVGYQTKELHMMAILLKYRKCFF